MLLNVILNLLANTTYATPTLVHVVNDEIGSTAKLGFKSMAKPEYASSTRYWDCCKPSYAWYGYTSHPVRSCLSDGWTTADPTMTSVCAGGDAYMCTDQQPFADGSNPNLAYGFAAANHPACSCFQLWFVDGPAYGKSMIVQVTNGGSDIQGNNFDIAIPGGGVGQHNGCSKQWGAPGDGWGRRWGGVSYAGECDQLPRSLQSGCRWRFQDWMNGADNPNVNYERVSCPQQLTSISQCW